MRRIRGYMAVSVDGFIAEPDGEVRFLEKYPAEGPVWDEFWSAIGTVVSGRGTWETVRRHGHDRFYEGRRGYVVTGTDPGILPRGFSPWHRDVDDLIEELRSAELPPGDVWVLGGGLLQQAFLDRGAIDLLEIFVVPELVGEGIRMFPGGRSGRLDLVGAGDIGGGVVRLAYKRR
ncbi:dihydrofolate reductase family protein [Chthonobacter albigriseus]|uniref:dihydrofolate reductase family protein n=1 Tax=Chthonobacter albigriseus TaxID=1683161 RepID=UPI0015EE3B47|nr:dihydrofolate reductase family protein [Chthonobacter albigriseus]